MPSWRDVLKVHPACELFPLMSADELKARGEDIKKNGLNSPIVLYHWQKDHEFELLDGRNRLDALEAVGYIVVEKKDRSTPGQAHPRLIHNPQLLDWIEVRGQDGVDPYAYAISANIRRRHLTAEDKRHLIGELLKATPERSNLQTAKLVGASHPTVAKVRSELEEAGDVEKASTSKDTKGRQQPVHKPKVVSVKPLPPPTPAQRAEEKIRKAGIADKKKHGDLSLPRVMEEVVAAADRAELVALANHHAPERHVRAREECEKKGIDWDPRSSAEGTAEERNALYACQDAALETDHDGLPALPEPNVGEKKPPGYVASPDQILSNGLWFIERSIASAIAELGPLGRLPEVFRRVRNLIDKLEAEAASEEAAQHHEGANIREAAE